MKKFFQDYGVLVALLLLVVIDVIANGWGVLSAGNIILLFNQNAYVGMVAVGMTFVIMTAGIDLSVGSMVALCGAVAVLALNKEAGNHASDSTAIFIACLASLGTGAVAGALNGVAIAYGKVAPFIVTLAGLAGFRSIALVLGGSGEIRSQVTSFGDLGFGGIKVGLFHNASGLPITIYWSLIAFIGTALIASFILNYTRFGRYMIAVGSNERAANYSAINTQTVKVAAYTLIGVMVGLAAFFNAARMNSVGTGSVGSFYELDAIAAVVIGGTSLRGGKGRIWGTVVGVVLLTLISNMMTTLNIDTNWQGLVRAAVILIAVLLQRGSKANE
ncbi:MAG TPA: ABC transporter permease [Fimbriimonadaceae bacterium]|nr:ABC transporter permease [Fimbriimonadaceae bacterium]